MLTKSQSPARDRARQGISAELNCPASTELTPQTQLVGGTEVAQWHRRQTPARPAHRRILGPPATYPHPRGREPKNPNTVRNPKRSTSHSGVQP